jgi:hypothetical protein
MTKIFYSSTLYGTMSLAASIDAGLFGTHDERWVLLVSNNVNAPEIVDTFFADSPAFATLSRRFDDVVRWNDVIAPLHPSGWIPPANEVPLLTRLITEHLQITDVITELVVESIAVAPARTLGVLIRDCPITVYSDGLMSYGPTRDDVAAEIGARAGRILYLDLVAGIEPLLLREYDAVPVVIPDSEFRKVISELPAPEVGDAFGAPVIIGQYLSPLGILSLAEENKLHAGMLRALAAAGHRKVVFTPHPSAAAIHVRPLQNTAREAGVELVVATHGLPIETWFQAANPELVVSCFSTALFTGARYFDIAAATMGAEIVLDRLTPYENSNRIPATLTDAVIPRLGEDGTRADPPARDVDQLARAVAFCMQPQRNGDLFPIAAQYIAEHGTARYFKKKRLTSVGLITPATLRDRTRRRARRRAIGYAVRTRAMLRRRRPRLVAIYEARREARRS